MTKILFVCHGNICRSTMAESVMTWLVRQSGVEKKYQIASAATSTEELGNGVHHGTVAQLRRMGVPVVPHRAVQMTKTDYDRYDLLIGMDEWNRKNMLRITGGDPEGKIHLLLDWSEHPRAIADPWYTGDFQATWEDVLEGCRSLLLELEKEM